MLLELAKLFVLDVKDFFEQSEDGDIDWVGARLWIVVSFHAFDESFEYGMELSCANLETGIWFTQVGEPLADGRKGVTNCASSDRFTLLSSFAILEAEDEEVADFVLRIEVTEGRGLALSSAEVRPDAEDLVGGFSALGSGGFGGKVERSAEFSFKAALDGRWSSRHGLSCG